jgi:hypothetical protein
MIVSEQHLEPLPHARAVRRSVPLIAPPIHRLGRSILQPHSLRLFRPPETLVIL